MSDVVLVILMGETGNALGRQRKSPRVRCLFPVLLKIFFYVSLLISTVGGSQILNSLEDKWPSCLGSLPLSRKATQDSVQSQRDVLSVSLRCVNSN